MEELIIFFLIVFFILYIISYILYYILSNFGTTGNVIFYVLLFFIIVIPCYFSYRLLFGYQININDKRLATAFINHDFVTTNPTTLSYIGNEGILYLHDVTNLDSHEYDKPTKHCYRLNIANGLTFRIKNIYYFDDVFNGKRLKADVELRSIPNIIEGIESNDSLQWTKITNFDPYRTKDYNSKTIRLYQFQFFVSEGDLSYENIDNYT